MILPPAIISIRVANHRHRLRLWLPVIVLWPLIAVAMVMLIPCTMIAQIALAGSNIKPLSMLIALYGFMAALSGTGIYVSSGNTTERENVLIYIK